MSNNQYRISHTIDKEEIYVKRSGEGEGDRERLG
jgi:hypothetical protein